VRAVFEFVGSVVEDFHSTRKSILPIEKRVHGLLALVPTGKRGRLIAHRHRSHSISHLLDPGAKVYVLAATGTERLVKESDPIKQVAPHHHQEKYQEGLLDFWTEYALHARYGMRIERTLQQPEPLALRTVW